jgi:hypothetical protein
LNQPLGGGATTSEVKPPTGKMAHKICHRQVRILLGGQNTTIMKKIINVQSSLEAILREYDHLSPDLPIGVFEMRCRQIHIRLLKHINAHAQDTI